MPRQVVITVPRTENLQTILKETWKKGYNHAMDEMHAGDRRRIISEQDYPIVRIEFEPDPVLGCLK